jgi:hypothetical protein
MNVDTGKVYTTDREIEAARTRKEPLVEVSPRVAKLLGIGRAQRVRDLRRKRRLARAARP